MNATRRRLLALAALAGVCACSAVPNAGVSNAALPAASSSHRFTQRGLLATIVGVGDSLTAGYQAGGFLGQTGFKNPIDPGAIVPPGQENGWWADVDEMASGLPEATAINRMYDPATSPLPLVKAPGLNDQLVQAQPPFPFDLLKGGDTCTADRGFNAQGYALRGLDTVRMNPNSTLVRNVAVPGITAHEAVTLAQPQSGTCVPLPGIPGLLSLVVDNESSTFWPVLGGFARMGSDLTMVRAAASLHPTLATVWLGANDVLKYMGSGGRFTGGDFSASQMKTDELAAIQALKYAGAKTVVLNLPDVLRTPYFMNTTIPAKSACKPPAQTYIYCVLTQAQPFGIGFFSPKTARRLIEQFGTEYHIASPAGCKPGTVATACGYVTLPGALDSFKYYSGKPVASTAGKFPDLDCTGTNFTPPCVPGSGLGSYYITPAFAGKIQQLNDNVNTGIAEAAKYTQSAFVDVRTIFGGVLSGDSANPYFAKAASINPPKCCDLALGGGLASFDGIHPSNTGYALIAYYVIQTIDDRYGRHIREIDVTKVYDGTRCSNKLECFPDVYAPH